MTRVLILLLIPVLALIQLPAAAAEGDVHFHDVEAQTAEFMAYNNEIELTPEQKVVFEEALTPIPAPCCSDRSALTCCCPCNQAKTWWGLTKHLIVNLGYDAEQARAKVVEWFDYTHPDGISEVSSCYTGRCPLPFKDNGCGGMRADQVNFGE